MKKKLYILLTLILCLGLVACGKEDKKPALENTEPEKVEYFIRRVDDNTEGKERLYAYNILVNDEANKASLKEVALEVTRIAEKETPFDHLSIRFYDGPQYIDSNSNIYNLGFVDVSRQEIKIKEDDSDGPETIKSDIQFSFHIKEKDWKKKLSKEEADIVNRLYELMDKNDLSSLGPAADNVAEMFNKSYEDVIGIFGKQLKWESNNLDSSYDIHDPKYDVFDQKVKDLEKKPSPADEVDKN